VEGLRVMVQPGTGYDLLLSSSIIAEPARSRRLEATHSLRERAAAIDGGKLTETFERIGREPFISLLGFAHAMADQPSAANTISAIDSASAREVILAAVGYYRRAMRVVTPPAVIRAAVDGDAAAVREFRRTAYPELGYWQTSLRNLLGRDVAEVRAEISATLRRWLAEGFAELEPTIAQRQAADVTVVRQLLADHDLDAVLERIVPGLTFAREVGQQNFVLAPSVIIRPGFALTDYGSTLVIAYPAAGSTEEGIPPDRLVRLAKAMGDGLRLRALRELRDGPMTASELARRLGVPRTTIHHHVGLLVNAGLARMQVDDARWGKIELREEGVAELAELAEAWLLGRSRDGGTVGTGD
jgi:DNA-binding transcriptional ArsR family regulator